MRRRSFWGFAAISLALVGGILFFWLVVMKVLTKFAGGGGTPCPSAIAGALDNPLRRRFSLPVLDRTGIRPRETVLEVGPGPGYFTPDVVRRVGPEGHVIAVDIQPEMIAMLERKLRAAGFAERVEMHVADAHALPLPDASVDRAFFVTVLPEIPDPVQALREVMRVLKPGGIVSMTENFLDPDYPRRVTTRRWAAAAGFVPEAEHGSWWHYTLNFRKPA